MLFIPKECSNSFKELIELHKSNGNIDLKKKY